MSYHQLLVYEQGDATAPSDVPNGLAASVPGAAVILTGIHTGVVDVTVRITDAPPTGSGEGWEEVEDVELISFTGEMRLAGLGMGLADELPVLTAHGPGRYGMRVHARGRGIDRDGVAKVPFEFYQVTVWPIEVGPQARARLGVGVAEELGLPDKSRAIREWARQHAQPQHEPGRLVRTEQQHKPDRPARTEPPQHEPDRPAETEPQCEPGLPARAEQQHEPGLPARAESSHEVGRLVRVEPQHEPGRLVRVEQRLTVPPPLRAVAMADEHRLRVVNPYQDTAPAPELPAGLVAAAPDSLVIRTLKRRGRVGVHVNWQPAAPRMQAQGWEESEEIEFVTTTGVMHLTTLITDDDQRPNLTYQGAGRYGLGVYGRARDRERLSNRPGESYLLVVWPIELGARGGG
ncbi:hypothetical protein BKM31_50595 [[Actinomadura] parvosata subsp. kistnae]|uniref:Uncharacterized protein n=1 Tax=[Actinomadura] parvosata subsp. kistnae TaxID=1909395 RepID=A0A1V0AEJ1_9ACTN|nr:hypothetical protein BKM31_50595 [Nonomuraea sp. ATCC 55076]